MQKCTHLISEILGQIYQDRHLYQCLCEEIQIHPDRLRLLHFLIMNYDRMTSMEIEEKTYLYGKMIEEEELLARQIFLCLIQLSKK